jgi:hypothetical protein
MTPRARAFGRESKERGRPLAEPPPETSGCEGDYLSSFRPPSAAHFSSIAVVTDFGRSIA